jgi:hypothetical protein
MVRFNIDQQQITLHSEGEHLTSQTIELSDSLRLLKVIIDGAVLESGKASVEYQRGGCKTHALLLGTKNGRNRWFVFSGATENMRIIDDEETTESRLVFWMAQWSHAH